MSLLEAGSEVGKYTILGRLATGGMSEIYLARQTGLRGFSKVVVLKLILPHLAESPSFMGMFINEAKLAAVLNHPNVIQIFDYGEEQGRAYIVMEYVDGRNLNRIARTLYEGGQLIPLSIALRIISDACSALVYAHGLTDGAGNPLRIIHRDVSRENILVTYSGQVKLVDFGIAKATFIESQTTEGSLKGKFAYMAPEVVRGEEPDHRIDLYALGVTLYSLLLARLPFTAKNHADLLEQIVHREPPAPREIDPALPEEVERIILTAMHKDKDRRYQQAIELQHDLEAYLMEHESSVMPYHLAQFMNQVFPPGTDKDRETYQSLTQATPPASPRTTPATQPADAKAEPPPRPSRAGVYWLLGAALLLALAGGGLKLSGLLRRGPDPVAERRAPDAASTLAPDRAVALAGGPDAAPAQAGLSPDARVRPQPKLRPPVPPVRRTGTLTVDAPGPGEVLLGGKVLGALPLGDTPLPAGRHQITVRSARRGYQLSRVVTIQAGKRQAVSFTVGEGTLRILVDPWAKVTLDGKLLGITPLKPIKVAEGSHELVFENSELNVKRRKTVQVKAGQVAEIKLVLE